MSPSGKLSALANHALPLTKPLQTGNPKSPQPATDLHLVSAGNNEGQRLGSVLCSDKRVAAAQFAAAYQQRTGLERQR
jgi:hypothetical protein